MMPSFRIVERTLLTSAAEHGEQLLIVNNTHQPASSNRPFKTTSRIKVAKAIIEYAIRDASALPNLVAVLCVGDGNFTRSVWHSAAVEVRGWKLHLPEMVFTFATQAIAEQPYKMKPGDIAMAMTIHGVEIIQTDCNVENREAQHDCLIVQWSSSVSMHDVSVHDVSMHSQVTVQGDSTQCTDRHSAVIVIDDEDREVTVKSTEVRSSALEHDEK